MEFGKGLLSLEQFSLNIVLFIISSTRGNPKTTTIKGNKEDSKNFSISEIHPSAPLSAVQTVFLSRKFAVIHEVSLNTVLKVIEVLRGLLSGDESVCAAYGGLKCGDIGF
jgi:uracil DNA glycosylase